MTDPKQRALEAARKADDEMRRAQASATARPVVHIPAAAMLEFAAMTHRENTDADFLEEYARELREGKL